MKIQVAKSYTNVCGCKQNKMCFDLTEYLVSQNKWEVQNLGMHKI